MPEQWAAAIDQLMHDQDLRARLRRDGTRVIAQMPDVEQVAAATWQAFKRIAASKSPNAKSAVIRGSA
jgi:hypothetical protein